MLTTLSAERTTAGTAVIIPTSTAPFTVTGASLVVGSLSGETEINCDGTHIMNAVQTARENYNFAFHIPTGTSCVLITTTNIDAQATINFSTTTDVDGQITEQCSQQGNVQNCYRSLDMYNAYLIDAVFTILGIALVILFVKVFGYKEY